MKRPREVVDHLMSRGVLGSMLVGTGVGKVVEKLVVLATGGTLASLVGWVVATVVFVSLYIFWADFTEAADGVTETLDGDDDA